MHGVEQVTTRMHVNRREFAFAAAAVLAASATRREALAQDEIPTTGVRRPGPIVAVASASGVRRGVAPVAIRIEQAGVDAPIETGSIVDGVMQNPTGPWVVIWYDELAVPGEGGNAVMAGHVDYWDTGPAIFWHLRDLVPGDLIQVTTEDGEGLEYASEWSKLYKVATDLTPEVIREEIVGPTGQESLTLITCGGPFDPDTGEYLERMVIRARRR